MPPTGALSLRIRRPGVGPPRAAPGWSLLSPLATAPPTVAGSGATPAPARTTPARAHDRGAGCTECVRECAAAPRSTPGDYVPGPFARVYPRARAAWTLWRASSGTTKTRRTMPCARLRRCVPRGRSSVRRAAELWGSRADTGPVCVQCPPQRGRVGRRRSPAARHPQRHALCAPHGASHPPLFPSPTRRSGGACGHLPFLHFESSRSAPHHAAPHYAARHRARQRTHAHTARLRVPCSHSTARAATPTAAPRRPPTPRYSQKLRRRCACWTSMTRTRRPRCTSRYCTVRPFLCFGVFASRRRRNPSCCAALRCTAARHGACIHSMSRHRLLALSSRSDVRVPRGRVRVSTGHTEAARLLLEHGASATLPCEGSPPLHLVASCAALPSCAEQAVPLTALLSAHRASAYALCAPPCSGFLKRAPCVAVGGCGGRGE